MPRKRKVVRKATKARKSALVKTRKTFNVNRSLQPIPQRYICKMKYCESIVPTTAATVCWARIRLNSLANPIKALSANFNATYPHQPYGHDTLETLYNRYRVFAVTYSITATDSSQNLYIAALPANQDYNMVSNNLDALRENPRCRFVMQNASGNNKVIRGRIMIPSLVGRSRTQYMADDRYQAVFGQDPAEEAILNILMCNAGGGITVTSSGGNFGPRLNIALTYHVECFDVKTLTQSTL